MPDTDQPRPQIEDGYIRIANELFEALCRTRFSAYERNVFDAVLRKTYGYQRKADAIPHAQISALTGIDRRNVQKILKHLVGRNILTEAPIPHSQVKIYGIQKNYKKWSGDPPSIQTEGASIRTHASNTTEGASNTTQDPPSLQPDAPPASNTTPVPPFNQMHSKDRRKEIFKESPRGGGFVHISKILNSPDPAPPAPSVDSFLKETSAGKEKPILPEIVAAAAAKIYAVDKPRYERLTAWIAIALSHHPPETVAASLNRFLPYASENISWWPYLDKILDKTSAQANARISEAESEKYKHEPIDVAKVLLNLQNLIKTM